MVTDLENSFYARWATADACEKLVREIFEDIEKDPQKYSGKCILFYGNLGSLLFCEVGLKALIIKGGISDLEIKSGNEFNGADFSFDVGNYVRKYLDRIRL